MGVIALGIGFATPLAIAGVVIHVVGHAIAKALGFYAATPLLAHDPRAGGHEVTGIGRTRPALGASMGLSLGALSGLPPSPLFVSEVLIVAGGFEAGRILGRRRRRGPALARLPRPRSRAARDDRRQGSPPRPRPAPGPARARRPRGRLARPPARPRRRGRSGSREPSSSTRSSGGSRDGLPRAGRRGARGRLALRGPPRVRRRHRRPGPARRPGRLAPAGGRRRRRGEPSRRSSTWPRRRTGTSARRPTSTASASPATSRCGRSSTTAARTTAGRYACRAPTPTRSPSARSTPG